MAIYIRLRKRKCYKPHGTRSWGILSKGIVKKYVIYAKGAIDKNGRQAGKPFASYKKAKEIFNKHFGEKLYEKRYETRG